jgi:hypothetical protein
VTAVALDNNAEPILHAVLISFARQWVVLFVLLVGRLARGGFTSVPFCLDMAT